jgi:hypothetical protein
VAEAPTLTKKGLEPLGIRHRWGVIHFNLESRSFGAGFFASGREFELRVQRGSEFRVFSVFRGPPVGCGGAAPSIPWVHLASEANESG